jgi:DNA-binding NarL/FixJ family response regulator
VDIRILLADDHKLMREGLRMLIAEQPNMKVSAEAEDGETAVALSEKLRPDIIIMDISMPGVNGIEATCRIVAANPAVKVIALSMHLDKRMVLEMIKAGAVGYLLKDCAFREVISAINRVSAGGVYISNRVAGILVKEYAARLRQKELSIPERLDKNQREILGLLVEEKDLKAIAAELHLTAKAAEVESQKAILEIVVPQLNRVLNDKGEKSAVSLTVREKEILAWVKEGKNNWEIASILDITQDTVKFHLKNIFQKLNVANRSQAIAAALEQNLIVL